MNSLWIFGCSFSSGYLNVGVNNSYGNLIGKEIGYSVNNLSRPGSSNDMIYYDLLRNVQHIKENDYIIFQFSSFDRIGHFHTDDPNSYFSTAGMVHLGIDTKINEYPFSEYDKDELETLLKYVIYWLPKRSKFDIDNTISTLDLIKTTKNVKYSLLCVNDGGYEFNDRIVKLPTEENKENVSMYDFVVKEKLTLSDEFPEDFDYYDTHPGVIGHQRIKDHIMNQF